MTQENKAYRNELHKKLCEKVQNGTDISRQDLSNALWLYEKTLKEWDKTLKFYEFSGDYYAIIKAFSEEEAIEYYTENVWHEYHTVMQTSMEFAWKKTLPSGGVAVVDFVEDIVELLLVDPDL